MRRSKLLPAHVLPCTKGGVFVKRKITVLGAGNGAQTMAGDLASRGHEVTMFEPEFC